jgi:hypothetical protein
MRRTFPVQLKQTKVTNFPVQLELLKRRGKRPYNSKPEPSEMQIQVAIIQRLKLQGRAGVIWWHCPNGELRDKRHAAKLKAMGTLPGVADLQFVFPYAAPNLFLELKARGRKLTDDQQHFAKLMRANGHHYECADNVDDAIKILERYGVVDN